MGLEFLAAVGPDVQFPSDGTLIGIVAAVLGFLGVLYSAKKSAKADKQSEEWKRVEGLWRRVENLEKRVDSMERRITRLRRWRLLALGYIEMLLAGYRHNGLIPPEPPEHFEDYDDYTDEDRDTP